YAAITNGPFTNQTALLSDSVLRNAAGIMSLTLGDLNPGTYRMITWHHGTENAGSLALSLTDSLVTNDLKFSGAISSGRAPGSVTNIPFSFFTDGTDVTIEVDWISGEAALNGFVLVPPTGQIVWTGIGVSNIAATSATAFATVNTNAGLSVIWDTEDRGVTNVGAWTFRVFIGGTNGGFAVALTNLLADTRYTGRFFGTNGVTSGWSASFMFASAMTTAQAPVFTRVTSVWDTVQLGWQDRADTETGYVLQRSTDGTNFAFLAALPANTTSYWDGGLASNTYFYRLAATNTENSSGTGFRSVATNASPPGPATGLTGPGGLIAPTGTNPETGVAWAPGDTYHLAFLSRTRTDRGDGFNALADWNDFINTNHADQSVLSGVSNVTWYVIGSTAATDARSNAVVSAPVYLMDGITSVASGFADMWDGTIANNIDIDENGNIVPPGGGQAGRGVWTGSNPNGTPDTTPLGNGGNARQGNMTAAGGSWMRVSTWSSGPAATRFFYALSQPLLITNGAPPDTTPPTPDPLTFALTPSGLTESSIEMMATHAYDLQSPAVEYLFTNHVTGESSGWQQEARWVNAVVANSINIYQVKARDGAGNETAWSGTFTNTPILTGPGGIFAPTGVNPETGQLWAPGDTYHLAFVTSTKTNREDTPGSGTDTHPISHWNDYVNTVADSSSLRGVPDIDWFAMASTVDVAANSNALVSAPVYRLDGMRVADGFSDMWNGNIAAPIVIGENGLMINTAGGSGSGRFVWTGSTSGGEIDGLYPLGNGTQSGRTGDATLTGGGWFQGGGHLRRGVTTPLRFYALSEALTIGSGLSLTKQVSADVTVPGSNLTYSITVLNTYTGVLGGIVVTDVLPSEVTFVSSTPAADQTNGNDLVFQVGALGPNSNTMITIEVAVTSTLPMSVVITNRVAGRTANTNAFITRDLDTAETLIAVPVDLAIAKDVSRFQSNFLYTITVSNLTMIPASNVVVVDSLPVGSVFDSSSPAPDGIAGDNYTLHRCSTLCRYLPGDHLLRVPLRRRASGPRWPLIGRRC
ncbi:MAG: hypothetical protein AAF492_04525, partial [Verrucomicrobiota bacterium]